MKDGLPKLQESAGFSQSREMVLLDLLKKATDFYEDIIGLLSGIYELSEYVRRGSPEDEFYSYVVKILVRESRCENASVFLVEGNRVVLKAAAGIELPERFLPPAWSLARVWPGRAHGRASRSW